MRNVLSLSVIRLGIGKRKLKMIQVEVNDFDGRRMCWSKETKIQDKYCFIFNITLPREQLPDGMNTTPSTASAPLLVSFEYLFGIQ